MGIFLRQSHNVKPVRWGSPADVQYSIWRNLEDIYGCNHESEVLIMPGFWGFPLLDYSKYGNHGTNHGAVYKDGSLDFDGVNDYVVAGTGTGLTGINRDGWTMSCIAKWQSGTLEAVVSLGDSISSPDGVILINRAGYIQVYQNNVYRDSGVATPAGFVHLALTRESSTVGNLYIDGVEYSANPTGTSIDTMDARVGRFAGLTHYANAIIDEVRISNVARSAGWIALFYDNPYGLYRRVAKPIWSIPAAPSIYIPQIIMF